jgi:hypothetical protein
MSETEEKKEKEDTTGKKSDWKAKLALITIAVCLVLAGAFLTKLISDDGTTVIVINKTVDAKPANLVSTGNVATPNATEEAIKKLGGPSKVKVIEQKENLTTIRAVETKLLVSEENKSITGGSTVAREGVTMIFGNETIETKKSRPVTIIAVERNVSKKEAKP